MEPQDSLITSSGDNFKNDFSSISGFDMSVFQNKKGQKKKVQELKKEVKKKAKENKNSFWSKPYLNLSTILALKIDFNSLLTLLKLYTENVKANFATSYPKVIRCAKLKTKMSDMLKFFNSYYAMLNKMPLEKDEYFKSMSQLTTTLLELELKASRRGQESKQKISSRMISSMFVFLDSSPEYILDAVLTSRFTKICYKEICIPIFKSITSLPVEGDELNYVRFLLVFKLWKQLILKGNERNSINRLAVAKLSPPPSQFLNVVRRGLLSNVLPTVPDGKKPELITRFYMTSKFNVRAAINTFMETAKELEERQFTLNFDKSRFSDEPVEEHDSAISVISKTSILDKLWSDMTNSSPASCQAIPHNVSSHVVPNISSFIHKQPQRSAASKPTPETNKFFDEMKKFLPQKKPELKNGVSRKRANEQTDSMGETAHDGFLSLNTNCNTSNNNSYLSSQISESVDKITNHIINLQNKSLPYQTKNTNVFSEEDPSLHEPLVFRSNLTGAKQKPGKHIQNMKLVNKSKSNKFSTKLKHKIEASTSESCRFTFDSVSQPPFKKILLATKSQTPDKDIHNEASDDVLSRSLACSSNHHKTDSHRAKININPNLFSFKGKINNGNILPTEYKRSKKVKTATNIRAGTSSSVFALLQLDKSLQMNEHDLEEDEDSSSDDDREVCSKQNGLHHGLKYVEPKFLNSQKFALKSQEYPNPSSTASRTMSGDTSNTLSYNQTAMSSQKRYTNTEIAVEKGCGSTLPNTFACSTLDEQGPSVLADLDIHSDPKSESSRTDCMFSELKATSNKSDYSIDALLKVVQTETEMNNQNDNENFNLVIKRECCCNSRDSPLNSNQQYSMESGPTYETRIQFDNTEDNIRNIVSFNQCGQNQKVENIENNSSNEQVMGEEVLNHSSTLQEPLSLKNWSLPSSYVNKDNIDNMRLSCEQVKTPEVINSNQNLEAQQILRALPEKIDVNKIELQVQAQSNIFTGDDDCESECSNLVIDEDHDSIREQNELTEDTYFALKNTNGSIEKKVGISELRSRNVRKSKSTHILQNENIIYAQTIPANIDVDKSNRSNFNLVQNDSVFLNSPDRTNVIRSCNNGKNMYTHEKNIFIPRPIFIQNKVISKESLVNSQCISSQNPDNSILIQENFSKCHPMKQIENTSSLPQNQSFHAQVKLPNSGNHRTELPSSDSFNSMQNSLHSLRKSPNPLSEGFNNIQIYKEGDLDSYHYSERNKLLLQNSNTSDLNELNQPSLSPNTAFTGSKDHIQPCERQSLVIPDYYNNSEEHSGLHVPTNHTDYLSISKMQQFSHNQGSTEVNEHTRQKESNSNTSNSTLDPVCLSVDNKDHSKEILLEFELGIAQEVEVSSATDFGQNYCDMSESHGIVGPCIPFADENSVPDISVPSQELDQSLCSPNKNTEHSVELQQVLVDFDHPKVNLSSFTKDMLNLHDRTLQRDYKFCTDQQKFKEFYLSQDIPPAIPIPFPPLKARCLCEQCSDNYTILLNNVNKLTSFKKCKGKPLNVSSNEAIYEKDQTCETDCNLPLKKRKTLTTSNSKVTSYPNTPMISIAQLQNSVESSVELPSKTSQKKILVLPTQKKLKSPRSCTVIAQDLVEEQSSSAPQPKSDESAVPRRRSTRRRKSTR